MTWILPKQLHTSAFAPDTEALTLDSSECSQICEQSLLARSKPSPARTWLQRWKRDSWTRHLSGRILKPSHGTAFTERWVYCLAATLASRFQQPESGSAQQTHGISGPSLQMEFAECSQPCASLRTSKDTSALDSEKSLANWKASVMQQRGDYLARLKLARLTSESASSSWPTVSANEDSYRINGTSQASNCLSGMARRGELGQVVQASRSSDGSHQESLDKPNWATPIMGDSHLASTPEVAEKRLEEGKVTLSRQMAAWATPRVRGEEKAETRLARGKDLGLHGQTGSMTNGAKLNPRWVETLMGLPVGWTMPSCACPATIAPTSSGFSATELFPQRQNELFASSQPASSNE